MAQPSGITATEWRLVQLWHRYAGQVILIIYYVTLFVKAWLTEIGLFMEDYLDYPCRRYILRGTSPKEVINGT